MDIRIQFARLVEENQKLKARIAELEKELEASKECEHETFDPDVEDKIKEIYEHWQETEIYKHKKLSEHIRQSIKTALNKYTKDEIINAIDNYAEAYYDEKYFFDYRWDLKEFLRKPNAMLDFMDDGHKWLSYLNHIAKNKYKYIQ